ncbi:hypothetical protein IGI37_003155 [Enterococcus sp. AZ194]
MSRNGEVKGLQQICAQTQQEIDGKVSSFYKFTLARTFRKKDYQPEIMLQGVDGHTFWGDSVLALGWYKTREDAEKEIKEIMAAMSVGDSSYELKYSVSVKSRGLLDIEMEL